MEVLDRLIDADAFLELERLPEYRDREYELIHGEMVEMVAPSMEYGFYVIEIGSYLRAFVGQRDLGMVVAESGSRAADNRHLVLRPDVAYYSHDHIIAPAPRAMSPVMPDLAVEVASPDNTVAELRRKAELYLRNETQLVWLVFPREQRLEVHRQDGAFDELGVNDTLSGEAVLPGFTLELRKLFSP